MGNELCCLIEKLIFAIQNQDFENVDSLDLILESKDFFEYVESIQLCEAELLYSKIQTAVGIINTQKQLLLDELTLLQNSKKALALYSL